MSHVILGMLCDKIVVRLLGWASCHRHLASYLNVVIH